jgi:hypothetical protein
MSNATNMVGKLYAQPLQKFSLLPLRVVGFNP